MNSWDYLNKLRAWSEQQWKFPVIVRWVRLGNTNGHGDMAAVLLHVNSLKLEWDMVTTLRSIQLSQVTMKAVNLLTLGHLCSSQSTPSEVTKEHSMMLTSSNNGAAVLLRYESFIPSHVLCIHQWTCNKVWNLLESQFLQIRTTNGWIIIRNNRNAFHCDEYQWVHWWWLLGSYLLMLCAVLVEWVKRCLVWRVHNHELQVFSMKAV
jgi:hypothetical protein